MKNLTWIILNKLEIFFVRKVAVLHGDTNLHI